MKHPLRSHSPDSQQPPQSAQGLIDRIFPEFQGTDPQFSINRYINYSATGMDLVNSVDGTRLYVTENSSESAEALVTRSLGKVVLPQAKIVHPSFLKSEQEATLQTYDIPYGSRPVKRTLEQSPYRDAYMQRLAGRVGELLGQLHRLDKGMFGLSVDAVALGHNGSDHGDDTRLFLVPPLLEAGVAPPVQSEDVVASVSMADEIVKNAVLDGFQKGARQ